MSEPAAVMGALPKPKIPISLVLGSGGARGYAHIGVIEELIAQGFEIRSIAGSSMGALVGGIHAAGKLDAFRDWVLPMARYDVFKLLDITITGGGFIKGNRIINAMREQVGDVNIEDLPISYTAVAVDLDAHREVWFSRGSLFDAIRASIAIPTIFRPHRYQGRLLVDGGLLNPLPVSPTLRDHTAATIAVDVNATPEPLDGSPAQPLRYSADDVAGEVPEADSGSDAESRSGNPFARAMAALWGGEKPIAQMREPNVLELLSRSLDTVQETITRLKLAAQPPDLLVTIPRNVCTFYDFHLAKSVIELGRTRTREALARWPPPNGNGR